MNGVVVYFLAEPNDKAARRAIRMHKEFVQGVFTWAILGGMPTLTILGLMDLLVWKQGENGLLYSLYGAIVGGVLGAALRRLVAWAYGPRYQKLVFDYRIVEAPIDLVQMWYHLCRAEGVPSTSPLVDRNRHIQMFAQLRSDYDLLGDPETTEADAIFLKARMRDLMATNLAYVQAAIQTQNAAAEDVAAMRRQAHNRRIYGA